MFYSVQGEGYHTGIPSIFIRFGGCNLACEWCD
ncbi:MAG TPA: 7-carboxy-7-deazaguanine synthase, partial [Candidatus Poseidoniales archaeon]|nr:7-carboxy-7-deazaguanine synthase [Candidatus Poseidoniales archaeon]